MSTQGDTEPALPPVVGAGAGTTTYQLGELIGRGGMGEVMAARDVRIGREVALKRVHTAGSGEAVQRFVREALIQARLDHPAIVPVYELGEDSAGQPYFTMKRLAGTTLASVLERRSATLQQLLRALVDVCLAIDFAHQRGVVHRDLKPSNIILGDYGEVYVLDWGIAHVAGTTDATPSLPVAELPAGPDTATGQLLGTPGYMAPEQMQGQPPAHAADVYALGAILFEILAGESLHPRGQAALATTIELADPSPAHRRPEREIAPELDAACVAALAPAAERPSARELGERIQRYLDGDRDLAARRAIAGQALAAAREALAAGRRADAMRAAARATALDPQLADAAELLMAIYLEPARERPPELLAELAASEGRAMREHAQSAIWLYALAIGLVPLLVWNGIRYWPLIVGCAAMAGVLALAAHAFARRPQGPARELLVYGIGVATLLGLIGRVMGPMIFTPVITCIAVMSLVQYPAMIARQWLVLGLVLAGWLAPLALQFVGLLKPDYFVRDGAISITSYALVIRDPTTVIVIFVVTAIALVVACLHARRLAASYFDAQRELVERKWYLEQLLPER